MAELRGLLLRETAPTPADPAEGARCPSAYRTQLEASRFTRDFYRRDLAAKQRLDRALARVEGCRGFAPGLVRLLRVHYWPECAEPLTKSFVNDEKMATSLRWALEGMSARAAIERLDFAPPPHRQSSAPAQAEQLVSTVLEPWVRKQEVKLEQAQELVAALPAGTYGRAVAELALSSGWSALLKGLAAVRMDSQESRARLRHAVAPLRATLAQRRVASWTVAARAAPLVGDWLLITLWAADLQGCSLDAVQSFLLPPLAMPPSSSSTERWLMVLPSYVAAHVVSPPELTITELRAMEIAGLQPSLRRKLAASASANAGVAELLAHTRLKLMLRSFEPGQAREARRLLRGAGAEQSVLRVLSEVLATAPEGAAAWSACQQPPHPERLLQAAQQEPVTPLQRAILQWDTTLLAGERSNELFERHPTLDGGWLMNLHTADPGLQWCRSGVLVGRRCQCPWLNEL